MNRATAWLYPLAIFVILTLAAAKPVNIKTEHLEESVIVSHECPDDLDGTKNQWYLKSADGVDVVLSCAYTVEDDGK